MSTIWGRKEHNQVSSSSNISSSSNSRAWQQQRPDAVVCLVVSAIIAGIWLTNYSGTISAAQHSRKTEVHIGTAGCTSAQRVAGPACTATTKYIPSDLEQAWQANAGKWEQAFCSNMAAHNSAVNTWLDVLKEHTQRQDQHKTGGKSPAQSLAAEEKMDSKVFSRFVTTYDCPGQKQQEQVTWIEPLSHGLRHPNALCNRGADVMDRTYLLLAHKAEYEASKQLGNTRCQSRACQTMYFDLGATTLVSGTGEAGQGWFFDAYRRQGFEFDRFLLWEARAHPQPSVIFQHVPKADIHKYQYFNIPVTSDVADPSNPVNILKTIAQPGDFVIFKLDIDNFGVEHDILKALKADPGALALVDEFFFEEHVNFKEMVPHWAHTVGPNTSLASSYATFQGLRQKGLRAHSWV